LRGPSTGLRSKIYEFEKVNHKRTDGAGVLSILLYSGSSFGAMTGREGAVRRGGYRGRLQVVGRGVPSDPYNRHTGT